ncbi:MAG: ABC transporter ATP-binding protein [Anaerovoracaceae bacterium]|jgi:iron complex transport system ATP-binding protein
MVMIKAQNLSAGYNHRTVISNISFTVNKGCMLGLLGRNGCGKTTLFRCMNGLIKPFSGKVLLNGKDTSKLKQTEIARLSAMVPQGTATVFSLNVIDMILLGSACHLKAWEAPSQIELSKVASLAEEMGILSLLDKRFSELSGGEQQLVLIARALMQDTPILFLDEPTSHLDFTNQHHVMSLVRKLVLKKDLTTIVTTHDPNIVFEYCDEALAIKDGNILKCGKVNDVLTEQTLVTLYGNRIALEKTSSGYFVVPKGDKNEM